MKRCRAFTLVELLVVIGIIALLISILLPALSKARGQANTIKCLSNVRQLVLASKMFANDHQRYVPTSTSDYASATNPVRIFDPYHQKFYWRSSSGTPFVADWASSLLPYVGYQLSDVNNFQNESTNPTPGWSPPGIFICPSDPAQDTALPRGYLLVNNVTGGSIFPISYGINADVTCLVDGGGVGRFDLGNNSITPAGGTGPLQCRADLIAYPSSTLMFGDCGIRPIVPDSGPPLNWHDTLYYTTNGLGNAISGANHYMAYTMEGVNSKSYLNGRIPLKRHGGRINIAFADGHAATIPTWQFNIVRVSPYK